MIIPNNVQRWFFTVLIVFTIIFVRCVYGTEYFTLSYAQAYRDSLTQFVQQQYGASVLLYILVYIVVVSCSLPLASLITLIGGYLYGTILGVVYANIGATIGSTISFLLVRYLIGNALHRRYEKQLVRFNRAVHEYGTYYLLMIHFVAVVPFFLVNVLAGLTKVDLWTFIWTTSVGIIPGSLVYAYAGQQFATIDSISDIVSPRVIIAFIGLGLVIMVPVFLRILKKYRR